MTPNALESDGGLPDVFHLRRTLRTQLNRGLPEGVEIRVRVLWPLVILPIALLNQILAPHVVWLALVVALAGLYGVGLLWVREQASNVGAVRQRTGTILVVGDTLRQDFELRNNSRLPVLWAEFADESDLPGQEPGRIVACGPHTFYRWNTEVSCERRGVYRLGPHRLNFGDPFGLYGVEVLSPDTDVLLIYPRVVHLPEFELPHGNAGESRQRRRPLWGPLPSASVSDYRPGDSLRHIHWRSTARRGRLMVKDLEIEPSGDVWVVLDLNRQAQQGSGTGGTLEYSIIVAASLAAKLLSEGERRAVGLLAVSGHGPASADPSSADGGLDIGDDGPASSEFAQRAVMVPPQPGRAQLWRILSALAPVEPTDVTLADLLHNSREVLGGRRTLIVVTAQTDVDVSSRSYAHHVAERGSGGGPVPGGFGAAPGTGTVSGQGQPEAQRNWLSELVHLRAGGLDSSVILIGSAGGIEDGTGERRAGVDTVSALLAVEDIPSQALYAGEPLRPALTFRRTRRVVRTTPTGGAVTVEVEEDVG